MLSMDFLRKADKGPILMMFWIPKGLWALIFQQSRPSGFDHETTYYIM